jgi:GH25 family lysozyme M1 (1,4-beta-N-acetylmuramidase)
VNILGNPTRFGEYDLWIANFGASDVNNGTSLEAMPIPSTPPAVFGNFITWRFWQARVLPAGAIDGISSTVDYDLFNGGHKDFLDYGITKRHELDGVALTRDHV